MSAKTSEIDLLELAARHQSIRSVFERHGVSWLLDVTNPVPSAQILEKAGLICGVPPAELTAEVNQAIAETAPRAMTRRFPWREMEA